MTIDAHTVRINTNQQPFVCLMVAGVHTVFARMTRGYQRTENKTTSSGSRPRSTSHRLFPSQFIMTTTTMKTLDDVARLIASKRRIVVLCGAGISVSCGIPDFRSANGLYQTLDLVSLDIDSPEVCLAVSEKH